MKTTLITTTIYNPVVLELYRRVAPKVNIIIAGDKKTPHAEVIELCEALGNAVYLSPADQLDLGYESLAITPWNCIMRRNIALLEAIRGGADVVVTIDDDNLPVNPICYFPWFEQLLTTPYSGLMADGSISFADGLQRWFNIGDFVDPPIAHRGFPSYELPWGNEMVSVTDAKIGVVAGLWYGDPDISAAERLVRGPEVLGWSPVVNNGLAVSPGTWAPFNSQNTAYLGTLAPLMAVLPFVGRYDDIWASYIAERIMWGCGYHVCYGPPFTWQERNEQSVMRNLKDEIYGMEHTLQFCRWLGDLDLGDDGSPVEKLGRVWGAAQALDWLPQRLRDFGLAWVRDLGRVV